MYDAKWYKHLWLFVNNIFSSRHTMLRKQWLHYEKIQLLKADITNSMTQNPPWWANTHSASQQILCLLWTYLFTVVQITAYYQNLTQITLIHSHTQKMEAYSSIHIPPYIFLHNTGTSLRKNYFTPQFTFAVPPSLRSALISYVKWYFPSSSLITIL